MLILNKISKTTLFRLNIGRLGVMILNKISKTALRTHNRGRQREREMILKIKCPNQHYLHLLEEGLE